LDALCPESLLPREERKVLPLFLSNKRALMGMLFDLQETLSEEKEERMKRLLQEPCPMDFLKYNAGFVSALTYVTTLLTDKLEDLKQED
jgi:hypothetical protein